MNNLIKLCAGKAQIVDDDVWTLQRDNTAELPLGPSLAPLILPLALWCDSQPPAVLAGQCASQQGLWLAPDDEPQSLLPWLGVLPLIAVDFPAFADGRGYSQAYLLRSRMGWHGELRAIGDVLRDQLSHMRHCGFDAFAVRADKSVEDAIKGLAGISVQYAPSVLEPRPLFRRR